MGSNTITISDQYDHVTFSDTSGNSQWETFLDLSVPTATVFRLLDGLAVRLDLDATGPSDLPDDAEVRFIVQPPDEEDVTQMGGKESLRRFNNADQYNEDEVYRLNLNQRYRLKEDRHFKMQVKSGTAVSASDSWAEQEIVRQTRG